MPWPESRMVSSTPSSVGSKATEISPSQVNLNAFDNRLRTIFSHMSRSTYTASGSGWQSIDRRTPLFRWPSEKHWPARPCALPGRSPRTRPRRGPLRSVKNRAACSPASAAADRFSGPPPASAAFRTADDLPVDLRPHPTAPASRPAVSEIRGSHSRKRRSWPDPARPAPRPASALLHSLAHGQCFPRSGWPQVARIPGSLRRTVERD